MKLRFYPRPGMLCWDPERRPTVSGGQPAGYVGRHLVAPVREGDRVISPAYYASNDVAYEAFAGTLSGRRLAKLCSRRELWAADRATAAFCGAEFTHVEQGEDGEWYEVKKPQKKKTED